MPTTFEVEQHRNSANTKQAEMQKLFVTGHLLPGADTSAKHIRNFLIGLGPVCGMNIFNGPHVKTPDSYDKETFERLGNRPPEDVNGAVMWDDSGVQLYIFPNQGQWFTLDIYTCKRFDPDKTLQYVYAELDPGEDIVYSTSTAELNTPWQKFVLPDGKPINPEVRYLSDLDQLFDINPSDSTQALVTGRRLEEIIMMAVAEGYGRRVAASYTTAQVEQLRALHSAFEIATDERFMDDILSGVAKSPDQYPFQPTYDRLSRMEATVAEMKTGKPVIHIGTGWPGTAIGLYRQFGIPVTCVEKDTLTAKKSREALERLGLLGAKKLQVITADGSNLNVEGYSAVIVSAMVLNQNKGTILQNMRNLTSGSPSDPLLILRTPADKARLFFYQELAENILERGIVDPVADTSSILKPNDPIRSIVCLVKETSEVRRGSDRIIEITRSNTKYPTIVE